MTKMLLKISGKNQNVTNNETVDRQRLKIPGGLFIA